MTIAPATRPPAREHRRSLAERFIAAFPLVLLILAVLVFYGIEAASRKTPWIFSDELEWTQLSRSIAATGHAARRTQPIYFKSLYAYLIAPIWWWINSTPTAYAAVKYANGVLMPLAAIPTYLLARMLVTRRSAAIVAVGSISIPAMAYATTIVPESLGYPYYALCSWVAVRALKSKGRLDTALAIAFVLGGYLIRGTEFAALSIALALAAAGLWFTGPRGRAWRRNWTRGDKVGAIVLAFGAFYLFNRVILQHVYEWQFVSQHYKRRMVDFGLRAGLSLTIGLGVLPVIGGLVALRLPERRNDPIYRAFVAWSGASIFALALYTADKSAYISTTPLGSLWEERNLIYLSPLLLIGTAMVYEAKRIDRLWTLGAAAFVLMMIVFKPIQDSFAYYEAPGSTIPALLTRYEGWGTDRERWALVALFVVLLGLFRARRRRGVTALTVAFLLAWMIAGEIGMTAGLDFGADHAYASVATPPNWVDLDTGGKPVAILGQSITEPSALWETEFWNRTIDHVFDLDGSAPGPGPHSTSGFLDATGILKGYSTYPYVLTYNGIALDAPLVEQVGPWALYRKRGPWRLTDSRQDVYAYDNWCGSIFSGSGSGMTSSCAYTYYGHTQKGTVDVLLSRSAYKGPGPGAKVTIHVGPVVLDSNDNPQLGHPFTTLHETVANGTGRIVPIPITHTPVRIEIIVGNLIPPQGDDPRSLGVIVDFHFNPAK